MSKPRTPFITGASTGIGAATARAAVKAGWNVGLMARSEDKLAALRAELGEQALALPGDATSLERQEQALQELTARFGGLDAAFANAGAGAKTPGTEKGDPAEWRRIIDLNILALLYTAKASIPHLRKTGGHLLLTGSALGRRHSPGSIYGASKWFVHGFAGNVADEMHEWGGRCTLISPGMVDTPFFDEPNPDKLQAEDVANAVLFALQQPDRAAVREIYVLPNH